RTVGLAIYSPSHLGCPIRDRLPGCRERSAPRGASQPPPDAFVPLAARSASRRLASGGGCDRRARGRYLLRPSACRVCWTHSSVMTSPKTVAASASVSLSLRRPPASCATFHQVSPPAPARARRTSSVLRI